MHFYYFYYFYFITFDWITIRFVKTGPFTFSHINAKGIYIRSSVPTLNANLMEFTSAKVAFCLSSANFKIKTVIGEKETSAPLDKII